MTKRNWMAKELAKPNYRPRVVPSGKDKDDTRTIDLEEYLEGLDDDR